MSDGQNNHGQKMSVCTQSDSSGFSSGKNLGGHIDRDVCRSCRLDKNYPSGYPT